MIALLLALPSAHAQSPDRAWKPSCTTPMSRIQLGAALGEVTDALEDGDRADAGRRLAEIGDRMPCLAEPADPALVARYARYRAIVDFQEGDEALAVRWGLASRLADPELPWDESRWPPSDPLRQRIDGAPLPASVRADAGFLIPKGGAVWLDGHLSGAPEAADVPHLAQRFDSDGERIDGRWLEGAAFPPEWLGSPPPSAAEVEVEPPMPPKPAPVARTDRRRAPIGALIASGAFLTLSGVSYGLAGVSAGSMDGLETSEALTAARSRANLFVVASGATFAGAVGIGVGGVIVSW